ncbi:nuclear transport factor 2-like isoform X2 [Typha angustifolia]|uniref:nuclear transport factor 2-like isoform X2 n=1 Tax=Typha angustifolia TaxID=59011 RepID=UPI003C2F989E
MALPSATPASLVSLDLNITSILFQMKIVKIFVCVYYDHMDQFPEYIDGHYLESSIISRPDANGVMKSATTLQAIKDLILSLDSKNFTTDVHTIDIQPFYKEGLLVLVTGGLTGKDTVRRKFTQSFFLTVREGTRFYVLNDIFRFLDEGEPTKTSHKLADAQHSPQAPEIDSEKLDDNHILGNALVISEPEADISECTYVQSKDGGIFVEDTTNVDPVVDGYINAQAISSDTTPVAQCDVPMMVHMHSKTPTDSTETIIFQQDMPKANAAHSETQTVFLDTEPVVRQDVPEPVDEYETEKTYCDESRMLADDIVSFLYERALGEINHVVADGSSDDASQAAQSPDFEFGPSDSSHVTGTEIIISEAEDDISQDIYAHSGNERVIVENKAKEDETYIKEKSISLDKTVTQQDVPNTSSEIITASMDTTIVQQGVPETIEPYGETQTVSEDTILAIQQDAPQFIGECEEPETISADKIPTALQDGRPTYAAVVRSANGELSHILRDLKKPTVLVSKPTNPRPAIPASTSISTSEVKGYSIYIRNLPLDATIPQVEEEFKKFGPIKFGGIQIRSNKIERFCFGFVEFQSSLSMQSAIQASPVMIGGRKAYVEEKKATTRAFSGGLSKSNGGNWRGLYLTTRDGVQNDKFKSYGRFGITNGFGRK